MKTITLLLLLLLSCTTYGMDNQNSQIPEEVIYFFTDGKNVYYKSVGITSHTAIQKLPEKLGIKELLKINSKDLNTILKKIYRSKSKL